MHTLSIEEKADALIALSIVFDRASRSAAEPEKRVSAIVDGSLRALGPQKRERVLERARRIGSLSAEHRQQWLGTWIENIRRRGRSTKLDPQINAEQISNVLRSEPRSIRRTILNYLPPDLAAEVELSLGPDAGIDGEQNGIKTDLPEAIVDVVKARFLANFVQFESVCDANAVDALSVDDLRHFVRTLGLREIAVACRGIRSKEKIAAFLCRFAEEDAKAIAMYLSGLDAVEPGWVSAADRMVQRIWKRRLRPHQIVHKIGLELLACAFIERSDTAIGYTSQKLSRRDAARWRKLIGSRRERLIDPDIGSAEAERKRASMIVDLARRLNKGNLI